MLSAQPVCASANPSVVCPCREVWPEGDAFGAADIAPEDEFLALREIHFAELPGGSTSPAAAGGGLEMGGGGMEWGRMVQDGTEWI